VATERQIPGSAYLNEVGTAQRQIPGGGFANETASTVNTTLPAVSGTFDFDGYDAVFLAPDNPIMAASVALPFNVTGFAAGLRYGFTMAADFESFDLSVAPSLSDHEHDVETDSFDLTGNDAILRLGRVLDADRGPFDFTGNEFVGVPGGVTPQQPTMLAERGPFDLTGFDGTFPRDAITVVAESGEFTLTGGTIPGEILFSVDSGSFTLTGNDATLTYAARTVWTRVSDHSTTWTRLT
jgi:hypothetical protein